MNLQAFLAMGGYAFYVWTAYGLALAVLLVNLLAALRRNRQVMVSVQRLLKRGGTR